MGKEIHMNGPKRPEQGLTINGGKVFRQVQMFKRLSALVSPSGKEQLVPVPVFRCDDCGHINDEFLPKLEKEKN